MAVLTSIPTGCNSIDRILGGGIPAEKVTLIYGEAETGKTTLTIQCAANCAAHGYKTLFVDCDSTFYAKRLSQIVPDRLKETSELIVLVRPADFQEQASFVDQLAEYVAKNFGLVVVDAITSLYRADVSQSPEKAFELNRRLNRQVAFLAQAAKIHRLAILLTSQVRAVLNNTDVTIEPVATRVLKFWADVIINLKLTESPSMIQAVVEKCPLKPQTQACHLKIGKPGIRDHTSR